MSGGDVIVDSSKKTPPNRKSNIMATNAAIYIEETNSGVYVNMDGYPEAMLPELERIQHVGLVQELTAHNDYMFLGSSDGYQDHTHTAVGVLPHGNEVPLEVVLDPTTRRPIFYSEGEMVQVDHKYLISATGDIYHYHQY